MSGTSKATQQPISIGDDLMQFRTNLFMLLLAATLLNFPELRAQDYAIEEMSDENAVASRPFSISRVTPINGGLRIFISTNNPDAIAKLVSAGSLQAQLSDNEAGTETFLPLSFGKAVWCEFPGSPAYLAFGDPLPSCDGNPPARIEYFFEVTATLGPGRDLAIGQDPEFLWLIEAR
jgi:hypothetical protein